MIVGPNMTEISGSLGRIWVRYGSSGLAMGILWVSNGPIQSSARKIWPLLELLDKFDESSLAPAHKIFTTQLSHVRNLVKRCSNPVYKCNWVTTRVLTHWPIGVFRWELNTVLTFWVCVTVSNSPNPSGVQMRLCKNGKSVLLLK